jgi:hypothetical protein
MSPAAQQVMDAFLGDCENTGLQMDDLRENVAAALRAAADQVVPKDKYPSSDWTDKDEVRYQLLAIADELEGFN